MSHRIGAPMTRKGHLQSPFFLRGIAILSLSVLTLPTAEASTLKVEVERTVKKETGFMGLGDPIDVLQRTPIAQYPLNDLASRKLSDLTEVDPETKSKAKFTGISLSDLVNEATAKLTAEDRAHFDLVVLEAEGGRQAYMPKAFLVKYPSIQLAMKKDGKDLATAAPRVILPATTNGKIQRESLILEPLFVSGLKSVILTSYEERFGTYLLKRRTDPAAMRGEKLYLQNCISCHGPTPASKGLVAPDQLASLQKGHPQVPKVGPIPTRFEKKDIRSLTSYLDAFKLQASTK